ncbi:hypothetical protein BU14_0236s0004, partial [Porphyra umbilicalis]
TGSRRLRSRETRGGRGVPPSAAKSNSPSLAASLAGYLENREPQGPAMHKGAPPQHGQRSHVRSLENQRTERSRTPPRVPRRPCRPPSTHRSRTAAGAAAPPPPPPGRTKKKAPKSAASARADQKKKAPKSPLPHPPAGPPVAAADRPLRYGGSAPLLRHGTERHPTAAPAAAAAAHAGRKIGRPNPPPPPAPTKTMRAQIPPASPACGTARLRRGSAAVRRPTAGVAAAAGARAGRKQARPNPPRPTRPPHRPSPPRIRRCGAGVATRCSTAAPSGA